MYAIASAAHGNILYKYSRPHRTCKRIKSKLIAQFIKYANRDFSAEIILGSGTHSHITCHSFQDVGCLKLLQMGFQRVLIVILHDSKHFLV